MPTPKFVTTAVTQEAYEQARTKMIAHGLLKDFALDKMRNESHEPWVLSFPGSSFRWEGDLAESRAGNLRLVGLEANAEVFEQGLRIMEVTKLEMDYRQMKDLDYLTNMDRKHDVVWLDYCGPWSKFKAAAIRTLFSKERLRFGNTGPLLALTVMDGMDLQSIGSLMLLANTRTRQFKARVGGIPRWIDSVAREHGCSAELKFLLHYRDGFRHRNATPMLLFILEIHPTVKKFDVWSTEVLDLVQDRLHTVAERIKR